MTKPQRDQRRFLVCCGGCLIEMCICVGNDSFSFANLGRGCVCVCVCKLHSHSSLCENDTCNQPAIFASIQCHLCASLRIVNILASVAAQQFLLDSVRALLRCGDIETQLLIAQTSLSSIVASSVAVIIPLHYEGRVHVCHRPTTVMS